MTLGLLGIFDVSPVGGGKIGCGVMGGGAIIVSGGGIGWIFGFSVETLVPLLLRASSNSLHSTNVDGYRLEASLLVAVNKTCSIAGETLGFVSPIDGKAR